MNNGAEPTLHEVLSAVNEGFSTVEDRFVGIKDRLVGIETRLTRVEATMVTKEYLDDKLANLKGDLVVLMRKEDTKLKALVGLLRDKRLISEPEAKSILTMDPFPQLAL